MLRRVLTSCLFALVLVGPAPAAPQELIPGLTYDRKLEFTTAGPVVANVLTVPRPGGLWQLRPALSNESIQGTERLTAIERRLSTTSTVAGVNGDLFGVGGAPSGILIRNGALDQPPLPGRSSIGIDSSGALMVGRVAMLATWQGSGPRRALNDVNGAPIVNGVSLFTPAWGPATPSTPGRSRSRFRRWGLRRRTSSLPHPLWVSPATAAPPFPWAAPCSSRAVRPRPGSRPRRPTAGTVKIRLILKPAWSSVVNAIGGGPVLVRSGKPVFRANEDFTPDQLLPRTARTAVGQLADGRFLLVTVDGSQPGYSAGVTNFELALLMVKLGAVTAAALDGGGSAAMAFDGQLLSTPLGAERPIGDALLASYGGVYVPQPLEPVLSPNGDGIAEKQRLAYKVVRPSTVTANLLGPDGVPRFTFSGPVGARHLSARLAGDEARRDTGGRGPLALGRQRDRRRGAGVLRRALVPAQPHPRLRGAGRARARGAARRPRAVATFRLTRAATVTSRIETVSGVLLRTLPRQRAAAGDLEVAWDGKTDGGAVVYSGRYVAEVTATNELGAVTLGAAFTVRRVAPPPPPPPKKKPPAKKK